MRAAGYANLPFSAFSNNPAGDLLMELKQFIQDVLGCGCPVEVFNRIDIEDEIAPGSALRGCKRIVVGEKLLVYFIDAGLNRIDSDSMEEIARMGIEDRDSHGYNRIRVALVTESPSTGNEALSACFDRSIGSDEKAHLHIISAGEYAALRFGT